METCKIRDMQWGVGEKGQELWGKNDGKIAKEPGTWKKCSKDRRTEKVFLEGYQHGIKEVVEEEI